MIDDFDEIPGEAKSYMLAGYLKPFEYVTILLPNEIENEWFMLDNTQVTFDAFKKSHVAFNGMKYEAFNFMIPKDIAGKELSVDFYWAFTKDFYRFKAKVAKLDEKVGEGKQVHKKKKSTVLAYKKIQPIYVFEDFEEITEEMNHYMLKTSLKPYGKVTIILRDDGKATSDWELIDGHMKDFVVSQDNVNFGAVSYRSFTFTIGEATADTELILDFFHIPTKTPYYLHIIIEPFE